MSKQSVGIEKQLQKVSRRKSIAAIVASVFFAIVIISLSMTPKTYKLKVGDVAPETILAPRDVIDEAATDKAKQEAMDMVTNSYTINVEKTTKVKENILAYFDGMENARKEANSLLLVWQQQTNTDAVDYARALTKEDLAALGNMIPIKLSESQLFDLLEMSEEDFTYMKDFVTTQVDGELATGIRETELENIKTSILENMKADESISVTQAALAKRPIEEFLMVTYEIDEEATQAKKAEAAEAVVPIKYLKGQAIVRQGEVLSEPQAEFLRAIGMLSGGTNLWMYLGVIFLVSSFAFLLSLYLLNYEKEIALNRNMVYLYCITILITITATAGLMQFDLQRFSPVQLVAMVVTITAGLKAGTIFGVGSALLCGSILFPSGLELSIVYSTLMSWMVSSFISSFVIHRMQSRLGGLITGILSALTSILTYLTFGMIYGENINVIVYACVQGAAGSMIASVLHLGLLPLWETIFKVLTPMKLMELCNPTNPLLKRLTIEAPGTYQHSIMVGNLAETAAEEIGANALLARAGAYYHDVGKLVCPQFFGENQTDGINPHNQLRPEDSVKIIAAHTIDGRKMIEEAGLPAEIAHMAATHHGNSVISYFYSRAQELYGADIEKDLYRHNGGMPRTKEAAIIMMADTVEAAVRANPQDDMKKRIHKLIYEKQEDGQFKYVQLTFDDLERIAMVFENVLSSVYHKRIEYPDSDIKIWQPASNLEKETPEKT